MTPTKSMATRPTQRNSEHPEKNMIPDNPGGQKTSDITLTLPDGSVRTYPSDITPYRVAESIGAGLAKATLAGKVNGQLIDACDAIEADATWVVACARR